MQLNCFYVNARSLVKKMDLLHVYANENKLDIMLLPKHGSTPTQQMVKQNSMVLIVTGVIDRIRLEGVAIYLRNSITSMQIDKVGQYEEQIRCKITMGDEHIKLGVIYRRPSLKHEEENILIDSLQRVQTQQHERMVLVGDFNYPDIDWDCLSSGAVQSSRFLQLQYNINFGINMSWNQQEMTMYQT